jgi:ATPase subunit of ABC transporter with duplicated ATPase domains
MKELSGGQKARVAMVKLMFTMPHFILLDEPTNHLDIETIEALIEGLSRYNGGIMVITHEEELVTKLDSQLWVLQNKKVIRYRDTFEDYCENIINS